MESKPEQNSIVKADNSKHVQSGYLEKYDVDVLLLANSDVCPPELHYFSAIETFSRQRIYIKTRFHLEFSSTIQCFMKEDIGDKKLILSGIKGLGKTTTALYYVLECIKHGNNKIHYINIERFARRKNSVEIFESFCSQFGNDHLLILDEVTASNVNFITLIKDIIDSKGLFDIKFLLIETGFTASAHETHFTFDKSMQLCEEEFTKIWKQIYTRESLDASIMQRLSYVMEEGAEVFKLFVNEFIMTPKLICDTFISMLVKKKSLMEAYDSYDQEQQNAIGNFTKLSDSSVEIFHHHTRILLYCFAERRDLIITNKQYRLMLIAINIFHCEVLVVNEEHLENDIRFTEQGLKCGDTAYRLTHLVPRFADYWREKLPFDLKDLSSYTYLETYPEILDFLFLLGGPRKALAVQLVSFQKDTKLVILPLPVEVLETNFWTSNFATWKINHVDWGISNLSLDYYNVGDDITHIDLDSDYLHLKVDGQLINVAKCAVWIKNHILNDSYKGFLLYPQIDNFQGIDYFIYKPQKLGQECQKDNDDCSSAKYLKRNSTLVCVHVATGAKHDGSIIARAFSIIKSIVNIPDIVFHVAIIVAVGDKHENQYTLTGKYQFSNVSVINLNCKLSHMFKSQPLLHTLVSECIKYS